jgi:hypothetical protein
MIPGTTKREEAPVAFGVEVDEVAVPVSWVEDGTTEMEVKVEGLPVAVKIPVSEVGMDAVMVLLPTTTGTAGALDGTSEVIGLGATEVLETGVA